jgi:hypothetical protein
MEDRRIERMGGWTDVELETYKDRRTDGETDRVKERGRNGQINYVVNNIDFTI